MEVRPAAPDEWADALAVLDAAMLEAAPGEVRAAAAAGDVLVAVEDGRVLGALVLGRTVEDVDAGDAGGPTARVEAVAVRHRRRGRGVGTALVEAATARHARLVASFDEGVRPFWEAVGFAVAPADASGRYVGTAGPDAGG